MFHAPEKFRVRGGKRGTTSADGNNGAFQIPFRALGEEGKSMQYFLRVVCSDADGWEHVSVSLPNRVPVWDEMCIVKSIFWDDEDVVMQLHPRKSEYVNCAPNCLHLWRPTGTEIPTPPSIMVGPKD